MKTIKQVFDSLARSPIKSTLTIITVGLGVGVLILVLSMTASIRDNVDRQLTEEGFVLMVANAEPDEENNPEPVRPPQFDALVVETIMAEVDGVVAVSPVQTPGWQEFLANDRQYRVRSAVAVSEQYTGVMELDLIVGSYFTEEHVNAGAKYAIITKDLATAIFGSADAALGQIMAVPAPNVPEGQGGRGFGRAYSPPSFEVYGVIENPSELMRKAYGIGDMIVPFTSILPPNINVQRMINFFYSTLAVRIQGIDIVAAESQIREALGRSYGDDLQLMVWEGTTQGESAYLGDLRNTISSFSIVGNILGFVLLAVASIGILSIMLVEAIGRTREIALERALGASNRRIVGEYFSRSVIISAIAGIVGAVLSLVLSGPLTSLISPIFAGYTGVGVSGSAISFQAIGIALVAASAMGGIFGIFPVFSVLRTPIAEGLRDA